MPKAPFIIFADARTGSTTLADVLRDSTGQVLSEPFNSQHGPLRRNEPGVKHLLHYLIDRKAGAKHLSSHLGIPLNAILLREPRVKIILLKRRNVLQQAVSWYLSTGATDWHDPARAAQAAKQTTISVAKLQKLMGGIMARLAAVEGICAGSSHVIPITYEDLYYDRPLETLNGILTHLTLPPVEADHPSLLKITEGERTTPTDTYRLIEGIDEIEDLFGSDTLGHLFAR
jgi:LPS sulfotransferase NodH